MTSSFKTLNEMHTLPKIYSASQRATNITFNIFVTSAIEQNGGGREPPYQPVADTELEINYRYMHLKGVYLGHE